jgi:exopolysaccharide biosynthesis protein
MPDKRLVPDCLHPLLSKNAATVTYNNFASDIGAVDRQISKWVRPLRKTYRVVSATAALVVMTSFAFYLYYASAGRNNTLVSIGDLSTIPSPDFELEWLKIKIERNFVDLFADNGVPVTHRSLGHPPEGRSSMRINGVVERLASGEVGVQILLEHPPYRVRSVSHNAPLELWTEAYKSIPAAILSAVDIDPKTTQPKASRKWTSTSFKASLLYLEAVRLAKAPQLVRALALIERAIAEDEKFAVAYWVKAQILRGLGRESEAATVESIATSIDPDHARPIVVGEPTKPLPSLFQRLQRTDWTHIERGMLYKRVEQESYGITLHAWSLSLDAYHLGVVMASNPLGATASEFRKETGSTLAVNGGFFAIDRASRLTPTGLVVSEGKMISSPSDPRRGGSGVVFNRGGVVGIDFISLFTSDGISAAVQVGPLVVDPGGKNGIRANDFDRQDRSAICLSGQTDFKIVVVVGGVSLFELGGILSAAEANGGFGCERALNLDGGPSTQVSFQSKGHTVDIPGRWKISNGLIVGRK